MVIATRPLECARTPFVSVIHVPRGLARRPRRGTQLHERTQYYVTTRDVAVDKWDSCRAIDCPLRTDRLALMCFVDLPARIPTGRIGSIEDLAGITVGMRSRDIFRSWTSSRDIVREIRRDLTADPVTFGSRGSAVYLG